MASVAQMLAAALAVMVLGHLAVGWLCRGLEPRSSSQRRGVTPTRRPTPTPTPASDAPSEDDVRFGWSPADIVILVAVVGCWVVALLAWFW